MTRLGPDQIITELRNWYNEANNDKNEHYLQRHYKEHLNEIFNEVERLKMTKEEREIEEESKHWICSECGRSTFETDFDYLASPTLHMACALQQMK